MDLINDWKQIRTHFNRCFRKNFYVSFATVDSDDNPTVTPIGSLFLNDDQTGFYFEKFPKRLPRYASHNPKVCILAVNSGSLFWLKALYRGRFVEYPAVRLYGELGEKRKASAREIGRLNRRMKATKGLKGNSYLWGEMEYVRDIKFVKVEKINLGKMTDML